MIHLLAAAFALQASATVTRTPRDSAAADSARKKKAGVTVSVRIGDDEDSTSRPRHRAPRLPVTAEVLRTAFADPGARALLLRAREARLQQDSLLQAYDAMAYMRISAGMGFSRIGRDRLIFRTETASHVRWQRGVGAWVDLKGARTAIPIAPREATDEANHDMTQDPDIGLSPLPYYPGKEALITMNDRGLARTNVDPSELVNPLAVGAEAYYVYSSGDSISIRLGDGQRIRVAELKVRPRHAHWNVVVGSLWFDEGSGRLTRAVYRMSVPMDVWAVAKEEDDGDPDDDVPVWVKPLISPMRASVDVMSVEYGLYNGRFWMPRVQTLEGSAQVSFMHVPFKMEQSFKYASVNGADSLAPIPVKTRPVPVAALDDEDDTTAMDSAALAERDSLRTARRDSAKARAELHRRARVEKDTAAIAELQRDSTAREARHKAREEARKRECDSTGYHTEMMTRYSGTVAMAMRVPCDTAVLVHSKDLPPSIFDPNEAVFGSEEMKALTAEALGLTAQPAFGPQKPTVQWGLQYTRYNRVEGLSSALVLDENLGAGYAARAMGRIGVADLVPNAELSLARSNGRRTISIGGYRRLEADNDWGDPLSFGSGLSSFLFARDEGFYYRSAGGEVVYTSETGPLFTARLFSERQVGATLETQLSLPHAFHGTEFIPSLVTAPAGETGLALHHHANYGLDPHGWRLLSDLRAEGAFGGYDYTRGMADLTVSHGLGPYVDGSLTGSAGTSGGRLPPQRWWYLGGTRTVRGQVAGTAGGDAFWMTHLELGGSFVASRPIVFGDLGWAGSRQDFAHPGRPLAGAGVGASFLDGMIRFDAAKGIYPGKQVRVDLYLEARF